MIARKIFVVGGTGYIGKEICKTALLRGHEVVGISRHGKDDPELNELGKIKFLKANAIDKESYIEELKSCDSVVHAVGVLMENDYKKYVGLNLKTASEQLKSAGNENAGNAPSPIPQSYEMANKDTAISVAEAAEQCGVDTFVYISAAFCPPFIDQRYLSTKRETEDTLKTKNLRSIFLRPGIVYSQTRPVSIPVAAGQCAFNMLSRFTPFGRLTKNTFLADYAVPPVSVTQVAKAAIDAIEHKSIDGVLDSDYISNF